MVGKALFNRNRHNRLKFPSFETVEIGFLLSGESLSTLPLTRPASVGSSVRKRFNGRMFGQAKAFLISPVFVCVCSFIEHKETLR